MSGTILLLSKLHALIQKVFFRYELNYFRGELFYISAKKEALVRKRSGSMVGIGGAGIRGAGISAYFLAEISVMSPRKLFIFII